ncbi:MAG: hypothetical protein NW220_13030 [Leptolyngbyaceae cyanobacterium bins.349]|nr:hypothetical protein [Leptolyngbyaceae cyanobacterium bins.349]
MTKQGTTKKQPPIYGEKEIKLALSDLKEMASKPKLPSLKDVVRDALPLIQDALKNGYSYEDIAATFQKRGVPLNARSLRNYTKAVKEEQKPKSESTGTPPQETVPQEITLQGEAESISTLPTDASIPDSSPNSFKSIDAIALETPVAASKVATRKLSILTTSPTSGTSPPRASSLPAPSCVAMW